MRNTEVVLPGVLDPEGHLAFTRCFDNKDALMSHYFDLFDGNVWEKFKEAGYEIKELIGVLTTPQGARSEMSKQYNVGDYVEFAIGGSFKSGGNITQINTLSLGQRVYLIKVSSDQFVGVPESDISTPKGTA